MRPASDLFPRLASPDGAPAVTLAGTTLSYRELADACRRHRRARPTRAGAPALVEARPTMETVIELTAGALAGAVSVPVNPRAGARERDHVAKDALSSGAATLPPETALLVYTSGTTGPPKGAILPRRAIAANLDALAATWGWGERDHLVHALPLFHVHGLVLGLFGSLRAGGHLTLLERFSPGEVAAALAGGATMFFGVPTMIGRLADAAQSDRAVFSALAGARLLVSGSAALPAREHRRLGVPLYERYGLTETLINCAVPAAGPPRPGWVGPPLPGVELRLVDDERRELQGSSDELVGEIAVRGDNVFAGYLGQPEATAAVLDADGWFYTGDLAARDAGDWIRILGRKSADLIKTGGFKVGAGEIEACLLELDGVAEAAVVGVPDRDLGERIVAYVVPADPSAPPSPEELGERVAAELAPHKRPRHVEIVAALPRSPLGKVQKHLLR